MSCPIRLSTRLKKILNIKKNSFWETRTGYDEFFYNKYNDQKLIFNILSFTTVLDKSLEIRFSFLSFSSSNSDIYCSDWLLRLILPVPALWWTFQPLLNWCWTEMQPPVWYSLKLKRLLIHLYYFSGILCIWWHHWRWEANWWHSSCCYQIKWALTLVQDLFPTVLLSGYLTCLSDSHPFF